MWERWVWTHGCHRFSWQSATRRWGCSRWWPRCRTFRVRWTRWIRHRRRGTVGCCSRCFGVGWWGLMWARARGLWWCCCFGLLMMFGSAFIVWGTRGTRTLSGSGSLLRSLLQRYCALRRVSGFEELTLSFWLRVWNRRIWSIPSGCFLPTCRSCTWLGGPTRKRFWGISFWRIFSLRISWVRAGLHPFSVFWISQRTYLIIPRSAYQYSLSSLLPICMHSIQSFCHWSSLVDLTLVIVGPNARWAPEQFEHKNTPKFNEAPVMII